MHQFPDIGGAGRANRSPAKCQCTSVLEGTGVRVSTNPLTLGNGRSPLLCRGLVSAFVAPLELANCRRGISSFGGSELVRRTGFAALLLQMLETGSFAPGRHAYLASAWVGCVPCVPVQDQRGSERAKSNSPHPSLRFGTTERVKYYNALRGFGVRRARASAGSARRWDHLCSPRLRCLYFSAPRRAPAPRARLVFFHSPGPGESAALSRLAASRDQGGRALRS